MTPRSRPEVPWARFDDLRAGTAVQCPTPHRVLVAERPEQVVGVLAEVERATDAGDWAFGYVAYEAAAGLDPHLVVHRSTPFGMPLVWFGLCAEPVPVPSLDAAEQDRSPAHAEWHPTWTPAGHARDVARVRDRIAAGDTYQCNLTVRMAGRVRGDPFGLYRDLAVGQRGAHNAYLDLGRFAVASASPELFFERTGDQVLLRPMKGTARRGLNLREDEALAHRLRSSSKEQAENVMIVDLLRNDVARVAETGSVTVPALVHGRTLRDGAPAHLRRQRAAAAGDRAGGVVPGAVPLWFRHRSTQGELHGGHRIARADAPWRLLRGDRSRRAARRAGPRPLQRRHPDRRRGHGVGRCRLRHRWRHHVGLGAGGGARGGPREGGRPVRPPPGFRAAGDHAVRTAPRPAQP